MESNRGSQEQSPTAFAAYTGDAPLMDFPVAVPAAQTAVNFTYLL